MNQSEMARAKQNFNSVQSKDANLLKSLFSSEELDEVPLGCLVQILLLENGNTIGGLDIIYKFLSEIADADRLQHRAIRRFSSALKPIIQSWKKRRCHFCLQYILDQN